jgi:phage terminase large subunit
MPTTAMRVAELERRLGGVEDADRPDASVLGVRVALPHPSAGVDLYRRTDASGRTVSTSVLVLGPGGWSTLTLAGQCAGCVAGTCSSACPVTDQPWTAPEGLPGRVYEPRGAAVTALLARDAEVLAHGPAGTGKSLACLWKLHLTCLLVPGTRVLVLRQTAVSLKASTLVTFRSAVLAGEFTDGGNGAVTWYGGSAAEPPAFRYPNGSRVVPGGLDKPGKHLSTEYARVFLDEGNQASVAAHEQIITRLRGGTASTYRQLVVACNPDRPDHWLKKRAGAGKMLSVPSLHRDNPAYVNADGSLTPDGADYMAKLDALTGVRRLRFRDGVWAAAEGQVFDNWSEVHNVVDVLPDGAERWRQVWGVDFGYQNCFVFQRWLVDPDGRMWLTHEISHRERRVVDHAATIRDLAESLGWGRPEAIVCDHDASGRADLTAILGWPTVAAKKAVDRGIQLVQDRIQVAADGMPRLLVLRTALLRTDPLAATDNRPRGLIQEIPGYVWGVVRGMDGQLAEAPAKVNDHSCDTARYCVAHLDWYEPSRISAPTRPGVGKKQPTRGTSYAPVALQHVRQPEPPARESAWDVFSVS